MNNTSMIDSSMTILPSNKGLADDIGIPIVLEYRPYDSDNNNTFIDLLTTANLPKCTYCSAYATSIFSVDKERHILCPFCGNEFPLPKSIDITYQNFKIDTEIKNYSLYFCFIIDLDCSEIDSSVSKVYMSIALEALLPETQFLTAFIKDGRFHFIKFFNDISKIISFDTQASIFDTLSISSLSNTVKQVPFIKALLFDKIKSSNKSELHEIIDISNIFSRCPDDTLIKFVMFSPNNISKKCASLLSFDWISPSEISTGEKSIDGFHFNGNEIENIEVQIQTMVQRYKTSSFAVNVSTQAFVPRQFEIIPAVVSIPAVRNGTSVFFTINLPRSFSSYKEVQVMFVTRYVLILPDALPIHRTQVNSFVYATSKDVLPILRTVNPVIVKHSISSKTEEKETIKKLLDFYKNKVVDVLPGSSKQFDPFFLILPNLQMFLILFLANIQPLKMKFTLEKEMKITRFYPSTSFWESQDSKIEELSISCLDSDELYGNPPIVVVDSCTHIRVYIDDFIKKDSLLGREIERKILRRFPVPKVLKFARDAFKMQMKEEDLYEKIRIYFDPFYKKT